jgi:OPT family oligopeptide transporter
LRAVHEDDRRTPEERDRDWLANTYRGTSVPQLTVRAIVTGMLLGGLMALSNLYVALKTGWSLGVTITAAVLAFVVWSALCKLFRLPAFGPLENNAMQSVASAAGYMTGGGTVAAIAALLMLTGHHLPPGTMFAWIGTLAFLGVFVAIPLKRQLINVENLRFPSGVAAAETVRSLHAEGDEARRKARALGVAGVVGALVALSRDGLALFPDHVAVFGAMAAAYTLSLEASLVMLGAGAIMGLRVALSQLAGALLCFAVLAPWAHDVGAITGKVGYRSVVSWTVWPGAAMMLTAGLLQFALEWRTVVRAFADLGAVFQRKRSGPADPLADIEVPTTWFLAGFSVFGPLAIFLAWYLFAIPIWMGAVAIAIALAIAIVAARSTGETDTTPTNAMGKLVQLVFGALHPGNITTNLMTAQACGGVAIHSADLLTDLKSGYLLGAQPRQQFFAQFFGVIAGSLAVVPAFLLLIPDAASLGTEKFPAPSAQAWGAVAKLLAQGVHALHPTARWAILLGGLGGIALVLLERALPRHRKYLPSAMGLGLAFTFPASTSIMMAVGALGAAMLERSRPVVAAAYVVAVASGLIAGESLMGVFVGIWQALTK